MKKITLLIMSLFCLSNAYSQESIYDIDINDIEGNKIDLNSYKTKHIMFVNVASECGFTKQYYDLEKLYREFNDKLIVIGLPCDQFGGQEPGTEKEIQEFCTKNFGVTFLLTEKINVKGKSIHPLYKWLTEKERNGKMNSSVKWNFQKYIINENGELINYFYSTTKPLSTKITSLLIQ